MNSLHKKQSKDDKGKRKILKGGALFVLLLLILNILPIFLDDDTENQLILVKKNMKTSGYWTIYGPIVIDELGSFSWADAVNEEWCSGNGTLNDPYIVENITVDALNSGSCFMVENSRAHFIVRNCTFIHSDEGIMPDINAGIKLVNTSNGQIIGNNCSNNQGSGIFLYDGSTNNIVSENAIHNVDGITQNYGISIGFSDNNTIINNNVSDHNLYGIVMAYSLFNNVSGNDVHDNQDSGFYLFNFDFNTISGNDVHDNQNSGIDMLNCFNNTISENNVIDNQNFGIYMSFCYNNKISGNNASNIFTNDQNKGIYLCDSNLNTISGNIVHNNTLHGICIDHRSNNNTIFGNIAFGNIENGICLYDRSNYNIVLENNASFNKNRGIYLSNSSYNRILENKAFKNAQEGLYLRFQNCRENLVSDNIFKNNKYHGIRISGESSNHSIVGNTIIENQYYGIFIGTDSNNHLIWSNTFIGNLVNNSYDSGTNNQWDYNSIGNYWDDYIGPFENGIGLFPYNITHGSSGSRDNYPLNDSIPIANFSSSQSKIVVGQVVRFTCTCTRGNLAFEYKWDFGDNTPLSCEKNPTHQYKASGIYTVNLTVIDANGDRANSTKINFITVEEDLIPILIFNETSIQIKQGQPFQFSCNIIGGNNPIVISWDFGDNSPLSNSTNPTHMYETPGTYLVTLTITDANGDYALATKTIIVIQQDSNNGDPQLPVKLMFITFLIVGIVTLVPILVTQKRETELLYMREVYLKKGAKKKKPKTIPSSQIIHNGFISKEKKMSIKERKEIEKIKSELSINDQEFLCIVHKGPVKGANIYLCPHCNAFYCKECIKVLKTKGENCWACNSEFEM
ncbi:MAG: NosD domain-containing protein [Promethearchaeota archaeon]